MHQKTISELEQEYDLELERIVNEIRKNKAKIVLLQFPDGMKPYSLAIFDELEKRVKNVEFFIWLESCFGACDVPEVSGVKPKIDMIVQFGHSEWKKV